MITLLYWLIPAKPTYKFSRLVKCTLCTVLIDVVQFTAFLLIFKR